MATGSGTYVKPLSMGVSLENGYFSEDGKSGFMMGAYAGRLNLSFWKKGENSGENRDNKISLNVNQALVLHNCLQYILESRQKSFTSSKNSKNYQDITNMTMSIEGFVNNQLAIFGVIRFDTVEIEGIKRIKITANKGQSINSVIFCDSALKSALSSSDIIAPYDVLDSSLIRLAADISNWLSFAWSQGAFNKIFNTISGKKPQNNGYSNGNRRSESNSDSENSNEEVNF